MLKPWGLAGSHRTCLVLDSLPPLVLPPDFPLLLSEPDLIERASSCSSSMITFLPFDEDARRSGTIKNIKSGSIMESMAKCISKLTKSKDILPYTYTQELLNEPSDGGVPAPGPPGIWYM